MAGNDAMLFQAPQEHVYRKALKVAVCAVCSEAGFTNAEEDAVETLTEMLQSFLTELARSTKGFSELSGRTEPLVTDVIISLIEMGQRVDALPAYARRQNRVLVPEPAVATTTSEQKRLQVGSRRPHNSHIQSYMPPFPDPHTYIKTSTHRAPCFEYQLIREKAAAQKRDVERALTRFIAKTGDTENLFADDPYAFPLIANKPKPLPYMEALMPKDQDLDSTAPQLDEDDKRANLQLPESEQETNVKLERRDSTVTVAKPDVAQSGEALDSESQIDNPYLREIKMPKLKSTSKKFKF